VKIYFGSKPNGDFLKMWEGKNRTKIIKLEILNLLSRKYICRDPKIRPKNTKVPRDTAYITLH
jgi:tRNA A58 N-methylase Trm61